MAIPSKKPSEDDPKSETVEEEIASTSPGQHSEKILRQHRIGEYEKMGFSPEQALELASIPTLYSSDVRESLIKKGCPPEVAYRIVS